MDLASWKTQLRKGAAELAVLAALVDRRRYGLEIHQRVTEVGGLELSEGSLYPLLHRLRRDGKLAAEWVEDEGASHPRKYYALTPAGRELLAAMTAEWWTFASGMERLLEARKEGDGGTNGRG